ncbi:MAG: hypothetical protein IMW89_12260, partial [Ktedonobacteraceae bacterium]|nr:hypothetical protein [Ktedonobacteraceae bacterium]
MTSASLGFLLGKAAQAAMMATAVRSQAATMARSLSLEMSLVTAASQDQV